MESDNKVLQIRGLLAVAVQQSSEGIAIADIDGAGGHFSLAIEVQMYYDKIPTTTHAVVQIISDSLENTLDASKDSSSSAAVLSKNNLDTLQAQDGWVAKEACTGSREIKILST